MSELVPSSFEDFALEAAFLANKWRDQANDEAKTTEEQERALHEFALFQDVAAIALKPTAKEQDPARAQYNQEQRDELLALGIDQLIDDQIVGTKYKTHVATRLKKGLAEESLFTLRQILVAGSERVESCTSFKPQCRRLLRDIINKVDPEVVWPERPDGAHAAGLYASLNEIPVHAINSNIRMLIGVSTVGAAAEISTMEFREALSQKDSDGVTNLNKLYGDLASAGAIASSLRTEIQVFAETFEQAKASTVA